MTDDAWRMSAEDAEEFTRALGQVMSGGWRQIALAQRLGVPDALGMDTDDWVRERIGGYVRLGLDERRAAVKELTDPDGEFQLSQRQAAEVLGVGKDTVRRDLLGGASAPPDGPPEGESDEATGASAPPDGWAEPSFEPGLDDISWDGEGDEEEEAPYGVARTGEDIEEHEPRELTAGDVEDEVARALEESGAFEESKLLQQIRTLRNIRIGWMRMREAFEPEALAEGVDVDEVVEVIEEVDRLVDWLGRARQAAVAACGPRRVHA